MRQRSECDGVMARNLCPICLEPYISDKLEKQSRLLQCGHTFCLGCLQAMLRSCPNNVTCPNCRVVFAMDPAALVALTRVYALEDPIQV